MNLTDELKKYADQSAAKIPAEVLAIMKNAIQELESSNLVNQALKTGDKIPTIELPNATGKIISIQEQIKKGKVIIAFYRGGWCPYCNLELKALQEILPQIKEKGASLIAITPETPDNSLNTIEKNNLEFEVLTDKDNKTASKFNLTYKLPKELLDIYLNFGINLEKSNNNQLGELPIAATYVVDTKGTIIFDYIKEDYKLRASTEAIIASL
ncbi:AhpC/TSA family protein [Flavobacterium sediminilitoris]|uniref:thioredoxin-dependent peroxiredoxin n=1 Tax=Flavobacterium sediminilitoris TaxID=2024526 RepID=A0ABY4HL71_9FLAO|nr:MULTISPECIES: peroxiredoxin-like family protein [Flavobacterium]UOX33599.1 AhpC/TSA family protein [Flavobacterium sediminilitoris]